MNPADTAHLSDAGVRTGGARRAGGCRSHSRRFSQPGTDRRDRGRRHPPRRASELLIGHDAEIGAISAALTTAASFRSATITTKTLDAPTTPIRCSYARACPCSRGRRGVRRLKHRSGLNRSGHTRLPVTTRSPDPNDRERITAASPMPSGIRRRFRLAPGTKRDLLARRDGPAIRDTILWFALLGGFGYMATSTARRYARWIATRNQLVSAHTLGSPDESVGGLVGHPRVHAVSFLGSGLSDGSRTEGEETACET